MSYSKENQPQSIWFRQTGRREFLRNSALLGLAFTGIEALAACGPKKPTRKELEAQKLAEFRAVLQRNAREKYGMEARETFQLSSGIHIIFYTDGDTLIINPKETDLAFNAGFTVLADQPDSRYKRALQRARSRFGEFTDREVHLLVPSRPNTCIDQDGAFVIIPSGANVQKVCSANAFTGSFMVVEPEAKLLITVISAAAVDDRVDLYPAGQHFELSPEEALSSNLSHEAMHGFLRMVAEPRGGAEEEMFIQRIERDLLTAYKQGELVRPRPFAFEY